MHALKTRRIGNSLGIILPKEMLEKLRVQQGDTLYAGSVEGGIHLTPYDPGFEMAMKVFERGRRKFRNALRELAKR